MTECAIRGVAVLPGGGQAPVPEADVTLDAAGVVTGIHPARSSNGLVLMPAAVDLHLDNLPARRRPRATVELDLERTLVTLDAEVAAAGIATVCVAARFEDSPGKGVVLADAVALCETVERLADRLAVDWRVHARVELTDPGVDGALAGVLAGNSRIALISMMDHSVEHTRFTSAEAHRRFYAKDWGVSLDQVEAVLARKREGAGGVDERRTAVAALARQHGIALGSHDDRDPDDVDRAHALGARIAEFPLTAAAARHARSLGMGTVLGAPNAVRGRSTSPGNLLAAEAVAAGLCDALCSDYLPSALLQAPFSLATQGHANLQTAAHLASGGPATLAGLPRPAIEVGRPLTAALVNRIGNATIATALWRNGHLVHTLGPSPCGVPA